MKEGTLRELILKDGDVVQFVKEPELRDFWGYPSDYSIRTVEGGRVYGIHVDDPSSKGIWRIVSRSPVREVTRKEIVPGEYGDVEIIMVYDGTVRIDLAYNNYNATQLRQVIDTLTQIADALEDAK